MKTIKDHSAFAAAAVAIVLALIAWVRGDAGRSQQLADLAGSVQQVEQQVNHMQQELDEYLLKHDGH